MSVSFSERMDYNRRMRLAHGFGVGDQIITPLGAIGTVTEALYGRVKVRWEEDNPNSWEHPDNLTRYIS